MSMTLSSIQTDLDMILQDVTITIKEELHNILLYDTLNPRNDQGFCQYNDKSFRYGYGYGFMLSRYSQLCSDQKWTT